MAKRIYKRDAIGRFAGGGGGGSGAAASVRKKAVRVKGAKFNQLLYARHAPTNDMEARGKRGIADHAGDKAFTGQTNLKARAKLEKLGRKIDRELKDGVKKSGSRKEYLKTLKSEVKTARSVLRDDTKPKDLKEGLDYERSRALSKAGKASSKASKQAHRMTVRAKRAIAKALG